MNEHMEAVCFAFCRVLITSASSPAVKEPRALSNQAEK